MTYQPDVRPRQTRASGALRRAGLVLALCLVLASTPVLPTAYAMAPTGQMTPGAPGAAAASGAMLWVYVTALVLSCGLFGLYMVRKRRQRDEFLRLDTPAFTLASSPHAHTAQAVTAMTRPPSHAPPTASATSPDALAEQLRRALVAIPKVEEHKECPECARRFSSWMSVCPFDATPLRSAGARARVGFGETPLSRKACPDCARRFKLDVLICPFDGAELMEDTEEDAERAPSAFACRACGSHLESLEDEGCGCEVAEPLELDPSRLELRTPALPMSACPSCHAYGAFGQTHCARDGELLLPVTALHAGTFPATGFGPRRHVCGACGTQFGGAARFCCHDGATLRSIN